MQELGEEYTVIYLMIASSSNKSSDQIIFARFWMFHLYKESIDNETVTLFSQTSLLIVHDGQLKTPFWRIIPS